ncbi:MAG: phosphatase PAP2 family protein [Clostridia bacterium]|jgi:membrane-associated phospholipid phosphatase|nr:phosphatase PAP2 family protein [Clostridia bacterium]
MSNEKYIALNNAIHQNSCLKKVVVFSDTHLPKIVMWIFYGMLLYLAIRLDIRIFACGIIPWIDFLIVTIIRKNIDSKRPFEALAYEPITPHSKGKSCPSRHASSSVIIAIAVFYIDHVLGIITAIIGAAVCISRVIAGVHYIHDVVYGALISLIFGYICFYVIL